MQDLDWNALKFVLKVAECGSTAKAAQILGVNATTVMRKITAFEQASGTLLFKKKQSGYETTLDCDALVEQVRHMEDRANRIQFENLQSSSILRGTISISTVDSVMISILGPCFAGFVRQFPTINLDVSMSTDRVNLARKDADIAIRATRQPPANVKAFRLSGLSFAAFASNTHAADYRDRDFGQVHWIGSGGGLKHAPVNEWMKTNIPHSQVRMTADTFQIARALAETGIGATLLPCCLGDTSPDLTRLSSPLRDMDTTLWIMVTGDLEHSPRVKLFMDHVRKAISERTDLLEGRAPRAFARPGAA